MHKYHYELMDENYAHWGVIEACNDKDFIEKLKQKYKSYLCIYFDCPVTGKTKAADW